MLKSTTGLFLTIMVLLCSCQSNPNSQSSTSTPIVQSSNLQVSQSAVPSSMQKEAKTPNYKQEDVNQTYGYWYLKKVVQPDPKRQDLQLAAIASPKENYSQVKLIAVRYDTGKNLWLTIWESPVIESGFKYNQVQQEGQVPIQELLTIQDGTTILAAVNINIGGAHGNGHVLAFTFDTKSYDGILRKSISEGIMEIKMESNSIMISGEGPSYKLSLNHKDYHEERIEMSEMSPKDAIQVKYIAGDGNKNGILPVKSGIILVHVSDTVAFVPDNDETKKLFDSHKISIYSDAWNGTLNESESDRIKSGNSYTFTKPGETHFVLAQNYDYIPEPTFTIIVEK